MKGNFVTRYLTKKLLDALTNAADMSVKQLIYSVDISPIEWGLTGICDVFNNIGEQISDVRDIEKHRNDRQPSLFNTNGLYMKIYHGIPILLSVEVDKGNNTISKFKTLNIPYCRNTLDMFIKKLCKHQLKRYEEGWKYNNSMNHQGRGSFKAPNYNINRRTFKDVFINSADKELLLNTIDNFINKRQWYVKNNLPYHMGVLLYGPPGTGKSVIAQAIAEHANARLLVLNGDDIGFMSESVEYTSYRPTDDSYTVFLIEDVDCGFAMKDILRPIRWNANEDDDVTDDDENKRPAGLATILNCIDGFGAPDNTIYVLTTNHIENLDPALIRPGRCDLKIEVGYVCEETFKQFIKFHYGVDINYPIIINRQITFAELQIHIMRGETVDQLIEFMKGDDHDENNTDPIYSV